MEPHRSAGALKATIQTNWGVKGHEKKKKPRDHLDGLIRRFSAVFWKVNVENEQIEEDEGLFGLLFLGISFHQSRRMDG